MTAAFIVYPMDVVKTFATVNNCKSTSFFKITNKIINKNGIYGLYKGLSVGLVGIMPLVAIRMAVSGPFMMLWWQKMIRNRDRQSYIPCQPEHLQVSQQQPSATQLTFCGAWCSSLVLQANIIIMEWANYANKYGKKVDLLSFIRDFKLLRLNQYPWTPSCLFLMNNLKKMLDVWFFIHKKNI